MGRPKPRVRTSSCTISPRQFTFSTIRFRESPWARVVSMTSWHTCASPLASGGDSTPTDVRDELYYECACWMHDGGRLARPSGGGRPPEIGLGPVGAHEP